MVSSTFDTAKAPDEPLAVVSASPHPWVINPWFDHLFVAGGIVWIMMLVHWAFFGWNDSVPQNAHSLVQAPGTVNFAVSKWLIIGGLVGTHIFSDSHTAATYMRVYATPDSRQQFKLYAKYLPWVSLTLLVLALTHPYIAGVVVYVHMMWVYQHYSAQSFGISLIYCYKRGYFFGKFEREVFRWMMLFLSFYVISRILCFKEFSPPNFFGVNLPYWGINPLLSEFCRYALIGLTATFAVIVVRKFVVERKLIPIPSLMLILSVASIGLSTGFANSMWWYYGAPFFHGSQYLAVALAFHLKEKGIPEGADPRQIVKMVMTPTAYKWLAIVFLSGIFIYVGLPRFIQTVSDGVIPWVMAATCIQACINFHHFVTDAAIWRLRDPKARKILLA